MSIRNYFISTALALYSAATVAQEPVATNRTTFILPDGKVLDNDKLDSLEYAWGKGRIQMGHSQDDDAKGIMRLMRKSDELVKKELERVNALAAMLNTPAPLFELKDIQGKSWSLKELRGKIVVLNFWFTSCPPCVREIPELNKLVADYKDKEVVFLGLAYNTTEQVSTFLKKRDFNYNQITNSKEIDKLYKINSWPTSIVIDKNGIIRTIMGSSQKIHEDLKAAIDQVSTI